MSIRNYEQVHMCPVVRVGFERLRQGLQAGIFLHWQLWLWVFRLTTTVEDASRSPVEDSLFILVVGTSPDDGPAFCDV